MDGHLPSLGWKSTIPRMVTHQKGLFHRLGICLTKLRPANKCHGWSPTIPRMVTHQPKDGYPTGRKYTADMEFDTKP